MQPKNLRERCDRIGITAEVREEMRKRSSGSLGPLGADQAGRTATGRIGYTQSGGSSHGGGEKSSADLYPEKAGVATFGSVNSEVENESAVRPAPPIATVIKKQIPVRLSDAQRKLLGETVFEFQATFHVHTTENALLGQFFDERFQQWVIDKLALAQLEAEKKGGSK